MTQFGPPIGLSSPAPPTPQRVTQDLNVQQGPPVGIYSKKTIKTISVDCTNGNIKLRIPVTGTLIAFRFQGSDVGAIQVQFDDPSSDMLDMYWKETWSGIPFQSIYLTTATVATSIRLTFLVDSPGDRAGSDQ